MNKLTTVDTMPVPMLVITGSSCAGKTTVLAELEAKFKDHVVFVPEAATQVLGENLVPKPDALPHYLSTEALVGIHNSWLAELQDVILKRMLSLELAAQQQACAEGKKLIIADRGAGDMPAYHPQGAQGWQTLTYAGINGLDQTTAMTRYHGVVILETLAVHYPEKFSTAGNPNRYETVEEARALHCKLRDAWSGHTNRYDICNFSRSLEDITTLVDSIVAKTLEEP